MKGAARFVQFRHRRFERVPIFAAGFPRDGSGRADGSEQRCSLVAQFDDLGQQTQRRGVVIQSRDAVGELFPRGFIGWVERRGRLRDHDGVLHDFEQFAACGRVEVGERALGLDAERFERSAGAIPFRKEIEDVTEARDRGSGGADLRDRCGGRKRPPVPGVAQTRPQAAECVARSRGEVGGEQRQLGAGDAPRVVDGGISRLCFTKCKFALPCIGDESGRCR